MGTAGAPAVRAHGEYRAALDRLAARGLLYPCFCTRAEIAREVAAAGHAPHGPEGPPYPGTCRRLSRAERNARLGRGEPHALRLDMAAALAGTQARDLSFEELAEGRIPADPAPFGDVVLARKDVPASYHLCVCHDDALQGVTVVTRGADLKPATPLHRLLQTLFGWPEPLYAHHALLADAAGRRLAKREGAPSIRSLREAGHGLAAVRRMAGFPRPALMRCTAPLPPPDPRKARHASPSTREPPRHRRPLRRRPRRFETALPCWRNLAGHRPHRPRWFAGVARRLGRPPGRRQRADAPTAPAGERPGGAVLTARLSCAPSLPTEIPRPSGTQRA
jgi:glutamyl-Q tRNA(Asp) synthetase